jgi:hypothetical protein
MWGGVVEQIEKAVVQPIGSALAESDKFINREIPGGYATLGAAALLAPYAVGALGGTAGAAGTAAAADAAFVAADAASLAAQGLSQEAIAQNLIFAGVDSFAAADAANLAFQGLNQADIASNLATAYGTTSTGTGAAPIVDYSTEATLTPGGNVVPATTLPTEMAAIDAQIATAGAEAAKALPAKISPMQAIQGARLATGLLGGGQQQQAQALPQMGGAMTRLPQGAVDYSGLYNLLALQRARNPNSLLG